MLKDIDCPDCYGHGRLHSFGRNGDPDDDGVKCRRCEGSGVITIDLNDEIDGDDDEP